MVWGIGQRALIAVIGTGLTLSAVPAAANPPSPVAQSSTLTASTPAPAPADAEDLVVELELGELEELLSQRQSSAFSRSATAVTLKPAPTGTIQRSAFKTRNSETSPLGFISGCQHPVAGIDGGYCQITWRDLQPRAGQLNTYLIDRAIRQARALNPQNLERPPYRVLIRIRAGVWSPYWLKKESGSVYWRMQDYWDAYSLPRFWSAAYIQRYKNLQKLLAARYDGNKYVAGVSMSMCMTVHDEVMWNRLGRTKMETKNLPRMLANGYSPGADLNCLKEQIDAHTVWKQTRSLMATHAFIRHESLRRYNVKDYDTAETLFAYCRATLGYRCILSNHSLEPDEDFEDKVYPYLKAHADKGFPVAYQSHVLKNERDPETGKWKRYSMTDLVTTLHTAAQWGGSSLELPMGWNCRNPYLENKCTATLASKRVSWFRTGRKAMYQQSLKIKG